TGRTGKLSCVLIVACSAELFFEGRINSVTRRHAMSERNGGNPVGALEAPAGAQSVPFGPDSPLRGRTARSALAKVGAPIPPYAARLTRLRGSDSFPFGIEEEFFLIDVATRSIVLTRPPVFLEP